MINSKAYFFFFTGALKLERTIKSSWLNDVLSEQGLVLGTVGDPFELDLSSGSLVLDAEAARPWANATALRCWVSGDLSAVVFRGAAPHAARLEAALIRSLPKELKRVPASAAFESSIADDGSVTDFPIDPGFQIDPVGPQKPPMVLYIIRGKACGKDDPALPTTGTG